MQHPSSVLVLAFKAYGHKIFAISGGIFYNDFSCEQKKEKAL